MSAPTFDTHKLIRTLKDSGIPENQAETIVEVIWLARADLDGAVKEAVAAMRFEYSPHPTPSTSARRSGSDRNHDETRTKKKGLPESPISPCSILVAGAGFEPTTFGL